MKHLLSLVRVLESCQRLKPKSANSFFSSFQPSIFAENRHKMGCASSKVRISHSSSNDQKPPINDDYVEDVVCKTTDLADNQMKTFDLADAGKVLIVRQNGQFSALGTKCTHSGAPLSSAALGLGRIRCQWHGACFNALNGDIEDFPGLDSLPCYQLTIRNDEVHVRAKKIDLETNKRTKPMTERCLSNTDHYVIIGGGPSGATCVETLRQSGFTGRITLICREPCLPYDRVKVSKSMDFDIAKAEFRSRDFYTTNHIDILLDTSATSVNTTNKTVALSSGPPPLTYTKLYIATGMRANKAPIPGAELTNVLVLRDWAHAQQAEALLGDDKEVVVLGSSFVAMEAAAYCLKKVRKVTLVGRGNAPFKPLVGERVGLAYRRLFEEKGVNFIINSGLKACIESDSECGRVGHVELVDGTCLKADIVIMGVGSSCNTDFLVDSGLELRSDGSIEVNECLETAVEGVYVGGDIAHAPVWSYGNRKATIGHYPLAHYHGRVAALNMVGRATPLKAVPYFWTMVFGKGLRYAGHGRCDDAVFIGDVEALKFVAFYVEGEEVVAVASTGMDPVVSQFAELKAQGKQLTRAEVEGDDKFEWTKRLYE